MIQDHPLLGRQNNDNSSQEVYSHLPCLGKTLRNVWLAWCLGPGMLMLLLEEEQHLVRACGVPWSQGRRTPPGRTAEWWTCFVVQGLCLLRRGMGFVCNTSVHCSWRPNTVLEWEPLLINSISGASHSFGEVTFLYCLYKMAT